MEHNTNWIGDLGHGILTGLAIVGGLVGTAVAVVGAIPSGGMTLAAGAAILGAIGSGVTGTLVAGGITYVVSGWAISEIIPDTFYLPAYLISPEEIFSNKIPLLDVNFFNPRSDEYYESIQSSVSQALQGTQQDPDANGNNDEQPQSSAARLQGTISSWYFIIRNFCLIALLSILLYVGIRIVISSSAQDKAKYKQRFFDWLIGVCLLFFLHYIMSFAMTISDLVTESLYFVNQYYYTEVRR